MNIAKKTLHMLGALSLLGSVSSAAWAGTCTTENRAFVNQDIVTVTCKSATGVTHSGQGSVNVSGAVKTIFASKLAGTFLNVVVQGADNAGNSQCQVVDSSLDGVASAVVCPNPAVTTKWRVILAYNN